MVPLLSLCWLLLSFPRSKPWDSDLPTPPLLCLMISPNLKILHTSTSHLIKSLNLHLQPNFSSTLQTQSIPSSTCLLVCLISFSNLTREKQNSCSSLTNLFLTFSSSSQLNGNSIHTAQAKNPESSLIFPFLPPRILHISKSYRLYLRCISRIRLYHMTK